MGRVDDLETALPTVFGAADLRSRGLTRAAARHRISQRRWVRVSQGLYAAAEVWAATAYRDRLAASALARQRNFHEDKVLSHVSAAALHGLALPLDAGKATWLTVSGGGNRPRRSPSVIIERATLSTCDVAAMTSASLPGVVARRQTSRGVLTSVTRTVADCARHLALPDAVAVADSAARLHVGVSDGLQDVIDRQVGWPGARRAAAAYRLLDPRRETWLESYSVGALHLAGTPLPEPQVRLFDKRGAFVARVDALWHEWGVVGEADGMTKYAGDAATPADLVRTVVAEKVREDRIRDLGLEVVRWTAADIVGDVGAVLDRLAAARRRGHPSRFSGTWLPTARPGMRPTTRQTPQPALRKKWS